MFNSLSGTKRPYTVSNPRLLKPGGFVGRRGFLRNFTILGSIFLVIQGSTIVLLRKHIEATGDLNLAILACGQIASLPCVIYGCANAFKRVRDIEGVDLSVGKRLGIVIWALVPGINLVLLARLALTPGQLSTSSDQDSARK